MKFLSLNSLLIIIIIIIIIERCASFIPDNSYIFISILLIGDGCVKQMLINL